MKNYLQQVFLIFKKDLQEELRSLDDLLSTIIFGVMLIFIFSFAFELADADIEQSFPAVLWVSIFFASVLAIQKSFAKELDNSAIDGLLLAVDDRGVLFLAKFLFNLSVLFIFELIITPLLWIFMGLSLQGVQPGLLLLSLILGSWGLAAIGTMLSGMTMQLPTARLLFPILLFPLMIPVLIAVLNCTAAALQTGTQAAAAWLYFLAAFDLLFTVVPLVLFDFILEG